MNQKILSLLLSSSIQSAPVSILTWKRVAPGVNGGVSILGLVASLAGGLMISFTACLSSNLILDTNDALRMIAAGAFSGLVGSLIDSLLGATLQPTLFNNKSKRVITTSSPSCSSSNISQIHGLISFLSNDQVNFISSAFTALLTAHLFS